MGFSLQMCIWIVDYHQQGADKASAWTKKRLGPLQHEEQPQGGEGGLGCQEAFGGENNQADKKMKPLN